MPVVVFDEFTEALSIGGCAGCLGRGGEGHSSRQRRPADLWS